MGDWDPASYLRFEAERTRPSFDLASRIELAEPRELIDLGCGPGNSTRALRERWPRARILGLDSSRAMIDEARRGFPEGEWIVADAAALDEREAYDLVFSNAALQWMPDHEALIPRLFSALRGGGALAAQIPLFTAMPLCAAIDSVARSPRWRAATAGCASLFTYHDAGFYYDLLAPLASRLELWETWYWHVLPSHRALLDFIRSTGLKPYLEAIPEAEARAKFEGEVLAESAKAYPARADGHVLFPFDRLFFVAYRLGR
jgi:trans-aconitate 2-methyltransferase